MKRGITIIGGGPAGLALGIALRRDDLPVSVVEAGHYPRHKVCGEVISGRGVRHLRQWGLLGLLEGAGARAISDVSFFVKRRLAARRRLPEPGLALSRFSLDHLLALELVRAGGRLEEGKRWTESFSGEGLVRATGRQPLNAQKGWRWFGLKAHARNIALVSDLELHLRRDGYVGLCRLERDWINVCGLFRAAAPTPGLSERWPEFLGGAMGGSLQERIGGAEFDGRSFASVAGLSFGAWRERSSEVCEVGDALGMIPPVTGNGLSMAFESAALAVAPLVSYGRGMIDWSEAMRKVRHGHDQQFRRRFRWGNFIQDLMFEKRGRWLLEGLSLLCWPLLFRRTR